MPSGSRSEIATATVPGKTRRIVASATHGASSSFWRQVSRSAVTMLVPRNPSRIAWASPGAIRLVPVTVIVLMVRASALSAAPAARKMP